MENGKIDGNARNAWWAKFTRLFSLLSAISFIIAGAPHADAEKFTSGTEQAPLTPTLKTGDYVWKAAASPAGPVVIIVSIPEQTLYVYRNGVRIGRSTVSTGKSGHRTPTGVFTILQKNEKHTSSIYKGASMPYMQRLTWTGVALHAGNLPGYPASHGCVRLPLDFAQKLYTVTANGTTVVVTDGKTKTGTTSGPGLLFASEPEPTLAPGQFVWTPEKSPEGPVSILFSSADSQAYVYRNWVEIGRAQIGGVDATFPSGSYAYAALAITLPDGSRQWQALGSASGSPAPDRPSPFPNSPCNLPCFEFRPAERFFGANFVRRKAVRHTACAFRLSQTWATELAETPVRVNWVDPGNMNSAMHRDAEPDEDPVSWADPAAITDIFVFLASEASRQVHGKRLGSAVELARLDNERMTYVAAA